ncbi:type II toxin-antitoxin system VapC family toxin [Acidianus infernus]|uniref:type II toxin-antitoxin system VapC family toxin n=1 Tax=Acidianus infernus TaxID=12915 RepID=UPI003592EDC9
MIDSNVFIYVLFSDPLYGERAKELLRTAEGGEVYSSTLVISQVLAHLERRKKVEAIPIFINYLKQSGIKIIETTWEDFINAIRTLQSSKLSYKLWDDTIIFSQMKRLGIDVIYSNDKDFDLFPIKREF